MMSPAEEIAGIMARFGAPESHWLHGPMAAHSAIDGSRIGGVVWSDDESAHAAIARAEAAFQVWRWVPAPRRGELVRLLGEELRAAKIDLGRLVTLEAGKVISEGLGEVQEMIDICDYAVGLSRQLFGLTIATERAAPPNDGDLASAGRRRGDLGVQLPGRGVGVERGAGPGLRRRRGVEAVGKDAAHRRRRPRPVRARGGPVRRRSRRTSANCSARRQAKWERRWSTIPAVALVSATGSTAMGRAVGPPPRRPLRPRSARAWAATTPPSSRPAPTSTLALRGVAFAAMGSAGQRCTTLRRLFVHRDIYPDFVGRLKRAYASVTVGDPREDGVLVGPLIDEAALDRHGGGLGRRATPPARRSRAANGSTDRASMSARPWSRSALQAECGEARDLRADPLRHGLRHPGRGHRPAERRGPGPVVLDLHHRHARGRDASSPAPTAASPTSTSAPPARRSAGPSAARRRPAAAANPARTAGAPTCGERPTR